MTINTGSRIQQVKAYLLNYIERNQLKRNDQLPSEASIAKTLGVSRNTLREVYVSLENEGVIVRRHGIGTFVAQAPYIRDSLNDFLPFSQIIEDVGYTPHFKTLSIDHISATSEICDELDVLASTPVFHIKRIVLADQQPAIYVDDYLSPLVEAEAIDWDNFKGNMVEVLSSAFGTPLHQIQSRIRAAALPPEISECLQLPEGTPVLSIGSTIFAEDNKPVAYSKIAFNSNMMELNIVRMIRKK